MGDRQDRKWLAWSLPGAFLAGIAACTVALGDDAVPDTIIVTASPPVTGRVDSIAPRLVYGDEFFRRFAPQTVGDMLRRLPGVAFTGNLGEPEAPRMRGLDTEYTQVLVDGQRLPTAGGGIDDESNGVFVDRIPAELVERIEVIRSPEATLDSQGIGGTLNIVLKSAGSYRGGQVRAGLTNAEDGTNRGGGYVGYAGQMGRWSFMGGATRQSRYNPKNKVSHLFARSDDEPDAGLQPDGRQVDRDVRDSKDTGLDAATTFHFVSGATLGVAGYLFDTARDEDELSRLFDDEGALEESEVQHEEIDERTVGLDVRLRSPLPAQGEWTLVAGGARTGLDASLVGGDPAEPDTPDDDEDRSVDDDELRLSSQLRWPVGAAHQVAFGVQLAHRRRDADQVRFEDDAAGAVRYRVTERRADAYVQDRWMPAPSIAIELGARLETTRREQRSIDEIAVETAMDDRRTDLNPDAHVRVQLSPRDQLRFSAARAVRRPNFDDLQPFVVRDGDLRFVGNPSLETETSRGVDVGLDHHFAGTEGILGVNLFYRDVRRVIEEVRIAPRLVQPDNSGDGEVWGAELDANVPLGLGLSGTTAFANVTLLDSRIRDPLTGLTRRFQGQPTYLLNAGWTQELDPWPLTWGASVELQGPSRDFGPLEVQETRVQAELQAFVEVRFNRRLSAKLSAANLLDARRRESTVLYDALRPGGEPEEREVEDEFVGVSLLLELRGSF